MALKLYSECIEDIDTLAMASDDEISDVNGFTFEQMKVFRGESLRIIGAHSTNSIRFLKGIDQETYDILTSMGIFLIRQLIDLSEIPKGVNPQIWDKIMEDGKALLN
jgi:predicted RecB family nuclease